MNGSFKWLLLATVFCVFAIVIMLAGLYRNKSILNQPADDAQQAEENSKRAKAVFIKHALAAAVFIVFAIIIRFVSGGESV